MGIEGRNQMVAEMMGKTPFIGSLGLAIESWEEDLVRVRLPFRAELTNDGEMYHGGVIASIIDTAGAAAAWSGHDPHRGTKSSTVSMTIQYVRAARGEDLHVEARAVRRARELIFLEITASTESAGVVAHALQTYRIA
ncbi:MAG TPA: PaaI family thioesterase [Acidimicrobiales bacterium]|nr:PaaI family thioesterase [Acidimicrobiales bacterium]